MSVEQAENIRRQYEEMRREKESELDRHRNFEDGKPVTMEEIYSRSVMEKRSSGG